ncbi:MAG: histidine phosphatase family protein [Novosphingobium sp.]
MFVIVRHGNTFATGETPRRIGARTDLPLTTQGEAQAQALGRHFAALGWHFDRVLVSPLQRTQQTARAILAGQKDAARPEPADFLREIDHGPDENQPEDMVLARIGQAALSAWDAHGTPPPGWQVDAENRKTAWAALFTASGQNTATLLVTSNGAARIALQADAALKAAIRELPGLKLPTGGYGVIRRSADGALEVPVWGKRP